MLLLAVAGGLSPLSAEEISSVETSGSWIYLYDADSKRDKTISKSSVGEVTGVAGATFTTWSGNWIYTWDKNGKKINTHSATTTQPT